MLNKECLHGFVGNSCPTLIINRTTGEIIIGTEYNDILDEEIIPEGFEVLTSVCTDLWWYSIIPCTKDTKINNRYKRHKIEAGKYRLEHYYGILDKCKHPYAKIVKIG